MCIFICIGAYRHDLCTSQQEGLLLVLTSQACFRPFFILLTAAMERQMKAEGGMYIYVCMYKYASTEPQGVK
jgi:hypothetical protein